MQRRGESLENIQANPFDVCVIGGGATGSGCALDSQLRGMKTVLLEGADFASGASSAATKIIHGGVRYLEEAVKQLDPAQYEVVDRALHERIHMLHNGPFLSRPMEFLIPCPGWFSVAYMGFGMKLYEWIAGKDSLFPSRYLSKTKTLERMPGLAPDHLIGSIAYADGQFDDARYNMGLINTFVAAGGKALNYARVVGFTKDANGKLQTAEVEDRSTNQRFTVRAQRFVNATGPAADTIRGLATPGIPTRMRLSKGAHLVLPLEVFPTRDALLIPKTDDGRVLFAVPWFDRLLIGTTEQEVTIHDELYLSTDDVAYLLHHINRYFKTTIRAEQIVSGFAGARPLVSAGGSRDTKKLARDHEVEVDARSGLISIMGGKWTTHRAMAEDTINAVQKSLGARRLLASRPVIRCTGCAITNCRSRRPNISRKSLAPTRRKCCNWPRTIPRSLRRLFGGSLRCAPKSPTARATRWRSRSRTCSCGERDCNSTVGVRRSLPLLQRRRFSRKNSAGARISSDLRRKS